MSSFDVHYLLVGFLCVYFKCKTHQRFVENAKMNVNTVVLNALYMACVFITS